MADGNAPELVALIVDGKGNFIEGVGPLFSLCQDELVVRTPFTTRHTHYDLAALQRGLRSIGASVAIMPANVELPRAEELDNLRPGVNVAKAAARKVPAPV